jgi:dTDP-4-dehydrorhamnose reductase
LENLRKKKKTKVVDDQYNNPTLAFNLAQMVKEVVDKGIFGLYHIGGADWLSRFEFAQRIALAFRLDKEKVKAIKTADLEQAAPRPLRGGLKTDKAKGVFKTGIWGVDKSLKFLKDNC